MATIAKLVVDLSLEAGQLAQELEKTADRFNKWGKNLRDIGGKMSLGITTPLTLAGKSIIGWASDLDESINKSTVLFGTASDDVLAWSKSTARGLGMSQQAALDFSSSFAGMLSPIAANSDELGDMSMAMTTLAADFGSFNNLSPEESFTVISSALAGETEAIRRFGVDVSAAAVEQKALEEGLAGTASELTEQDKLYARYLLILEQTTDAQGDFERTANSTSNRLKTFRARLQDVGSGFGRLLLPYVDKAISKMGRFLDWLEKLDPGTKKWALGVAAVAAAMGPLLVGIGMILPGLGAFLSVMAFLLSPIGLVVAALGVLAYVFRDDIVDAVQKVIEVFGKILDSFNKFRDMGLSPVQAALVALQETFPRFGAALGSIRQLVDNLSDAFRALKAGDWAGMFESLGAAARNVGSAIVNTIRAIEWGTIASAIWGVITTAAEWVGQQVLKIPSILVDVAGWLPGAISDVWAWLKGWIFGDGGASGLAGDGTGGAAYGHPIDLGSILLDVAGWLKGTWPDVQEFLKTNIGDPLRHAVDLALDVDNLSMGGIKDFEDAVAGIKADWQRIRSLMEWVRDADLSMGGIKDHEDAVQGMKNDWQRIKGFMLWVQDTFTLGMGIKDTDTYVEGIMNDWNKIKSVMSWVKDTTDLGVGISSWGDAVEGIKNDWERIKNLITWVQNAFSNGFGSESLTDAQEDVQYGGRGGGGTNIGTGGGGGTGAQGGPTRFGGGGAFAAGALLARSAMDDLIRIAERAGKALSLFASTAATSFASTGKAASAGIVPISPLVSALAGMLTGQGVAAFVQTSAAAQLHFTAIRSVAQASFSAMQSVISSSTSQASSTARSQISSMASSITSQVNSMASQVQGRFTSLQGSVSGSLTAMAGYARSASSQLVAALASGASQAVSIVSSTLSVLPGMVSSLSGSMYGAGADAMQGLINGAQSRLGALEGVVNQAIAIMARIPSLGNSPWPMMIGAGHDAMDGLIIGVNDRQPRLGRAIDGAISQFSSATPSLQPNMSDMRGSEGNGETHQYFFALTSEEFKKLLAKAENGDFFARNFGREMMLVLGKH